MDPTPGPLDYDSALKKIGDKYSVIVPFNKQIRPISAKEGQIRSTIYPGPQDYKTVPVEKFRRRNSVIPSCKFTKAGSDPEALYIRSDRAKSPGPQTYRP